MKRVQWTIFIWLCSLCVLSAQTLRERLDALVESAPVLQRSEVGITVFDLTEGTSLYQYQADKLYRPASTEKVITAVTALARLGENHCFRTHLSYTGTLCKDTLKGNLYVAGGFDPEFTEEDLDRFAQAVYDAGIRTIEGDLIGDVSLTDSVYWGPGWSWDDTPESFQPYLSALMLNRGCVKITVTPQSKGESPQVEVNPVSDYYTVDNQAKSYDATSGKLRITRDWLHNGNTIRISGNVTRQTTRVLNLYSSENFFLQTFRCRLREKGITLRAVSKGLCPSDTISLAVCSRPIDEVLKRALKKSDNLSAEALFHHVGIQEADTLYVGFEESQEAICRFMKEEIGHLPDHYRIVDGSGVSLYNYVSPALLLAYLKYAYYHAPVFQPFYEALPIAGIDGTLQGRMKKGKAFRNVRAKTGSVTGVSSLAGYVHASNGHMLAFVIINQNVLKSREARSFQDKICEILAR